MDAIEYMCAVCLHVYRDFDEPFRENYVRTSYHIEKDTVYGKQLNKY